MSRSANGHIWKYFVSIPNTINVITVVVWRRLIRLQHCYTHEDSMVVLECAKFRCGRTDVRENIDERRLLWSNLEFDRSAWLSLDMCDGGSLGCMGGKKTMRIRLYTYTCISFFLLILPLICAQIQLIQSVQLEVFLFWILYFISTLVYKCITLKWINLSIHHHFQYTTNHLTEGWPCERVSMMLCGIWPMGTNFTCILVKNTRHVKKMHMKMSSTTMLSRPLPELHGPFPVSWSE